MSVVSRVVLAGLVCASLGIVQAPSVARAQAAAGGDNPTADTRGRLVHASKCVMSFGFGSGCDKDAPASKPARGAKGAEGAAVTKTADDNSTRGRLFHASKCVVSFGFGGDCDKDTAGGSSGAARQRAEAAPAAPDTSTKGQLMHASKCVMSFGFLGDCDRK